MNLSDIDATLEGGRFFSGALKGFLIFTITILLLIVVIIAIAFSCGIVTLELYQTILLLVLSTLLLGGAAACLLYFLCQNRKTEILIKEYLKDAVRLKASVTDMSDSLVHRIYSGIKIQISFRYNDIDYVRQSGKKDGKKADNGYDKVFIKYANKEVPILFSPNYEQVLFLKPRR